MSLRNIELLPSTQGTVYGVVGPEISCTQNSKSVSSLFTIMMNTNNFHGRIYVEGTIAVEPGANDWFTIPIPNLSTEYIEFPYENANVVGGTSTYGFSFKGNFTWIRVRVERSYLNLENMSPQLVRAYGYIDQILLNISGP